MKNHNWKLLGLTLALALLFACLLGGAALADLDGLDIDMNHQVERGNDLAIGYKPAQDGGEVIIPTISVYCVNDGKPVDTSGVRHNAKTRQYVLPTDDLEPGNVYCVTLTASTEYDDPLTVEDCFRVESSDNFAAWLDVDNDNPNTNQFVRLTFGAGGSSRVKEFALYDGKETIDHWSGDQYYDQLNNEGKIEYRYSWEDKTNAKLYVRALFYDRTTKQDVWVSSDVQRVEVKTTKNKPIGAAVINDESLLANKNRGDVITFTVAPESVKGAWLGVEIISRDTLGEVVYSGNLDPDDIQIPTAELPDGNYNLYVWWKPSAFHQT